MFGFGNRESAEAAGEAKKMEIQGGFAKSLEALRTNSYTVEEFGATRANLSELESAVE